MSLLSLVPVQEPHHRDPLHETAHTIAQKLTPRLQGAVDPNAMLGRHEEVAALRRVMARLLRDVIAPRAIPVIPPAREQLAQNGVQRLLHARWSNMPPTQIKLGHRDEPLDRIVDGGHGEESFGVCHEIGDAFQHRLGLEDEGRQRDAGQVGAWPQLADDVLEDIALFAADDRLVFVAALFGAVPPRRRVGAAAVSVAEGAERGHCG